MPTGSGYCCNRLPLQPTKSGDRLIDLGDRSSKSSMVAGATGDCLKPFRINQSLHLLAFLHRSEWDRGYLLIIVSCLLIVIDIDILLN